MKKLATILLTATLAGCSARPSSLQITAPVAPLRSPSGWRSGIVDDAVREATERSQIRYQERLRRRHKCEP